MGSLVKDVNAYFRDANASEVKALKESILLSERQSDIFDRYYIKRQTTGFIADTIGVCPRVVTDELGRIRRKIAVVKTFRLP